MENNWASENLQVIRTLMERSALYRRALAPVMIWSGTVGIAAWIVGINAGVDTAQQFTVFWIAVGFLVACGSFFLVRRQALKDAEAIWSPPTRRVAQAALPGFFLGGVFSLLFLWGAGESVVNAQMTLPPVWMALYGCALNAAGFFMPRGIRLFGWFFIIAGCVLLGLIQRSEADLPFSAHTLMGISFGFLHFAYGVYLYFTEKRKNAV